MIRTYRDTADGAQLLVETLVELDVGEALHAGASRPCPCRLPSDSATAETDEVRALLTGRRATLAPKIEE